MPTASPTIDHAAADLPPGPLTETDLREHVFPLFSRVLTSLEAREEIYLANHSLGRPLDQTADDLAEAVNLWYTDMDGAWEAWLAEMDAYRTGVARLIGRDRADAVVPKTSAGQGLRAVLNALPAERPRVVATTGEFDSIDFILRTYARKGRAEIELVPPDEHGLFHAGDIIAAVTPETDLVVVSQAVFATGQVIERVGSIIETARDRGALVCLDTYHSAGAMPVRFDELGADFAIGGSYKYTRGGPGACWLAVADRHLRDAGAPPATGLFTLDTGWFAKQDTFAFRRTPEPELSAGGDAWLESTPPFLPPYQARAGLALTLALGVDRLREYNRLQQAALADALRDNGVEPRELEPRGAFLLVAHPEAKAVSARLREEGVNTDARPCPSGRGGHVRLCPDILTTADEIRRAAGVVGRCLREPGA
jgi:kynureninase